MLTINKTVLLLLLGFGFLGVKIPGDFTELPNKTRLSEYPFFVGNLADLQPGPNTFEYEVNAPLFSDYAEKKRFIYLPSGTQMQWREADAFEFPTGAAIVKNFYYENQLKEKGRNLLETRVLLKDAQGWKALAYVWNTEHTDAFLEVTGSTLPITFTGPTGKKIKLDYVVPNLNQCKGCHSYDGNFVPIGVTARQLNRIENGENQLHTWSKSGKIALPDTLNLEKITTLFDYRSIKQPEKEASKTLEQAARAYLDGNCAHCHNPHGPASTSGMFLEASQVDPERLGVGKAPVAAGRGSGNRKYGIVPGKPGESILLYRMENNDPGIRMPEIGRQMAHQEGIDLIKNWIKSM